jgi:uncharacterized protein (TIGR02145 family)
MKKLTNLFILMIIGSSVLFAQNNIKEQIKNKDRITNTDVDPNVKVNPYATTFTDDLFNEHFQFPCGDCSGEAGIETNGDYIYTSKWNGEGFFCYEMDGTFLGAFPVPGESAVRDMAYDGTYFYGAAASTALYEMDFVGQSGTLISTLTAAVATRACAYDAEYDGFWGNNWSDPITLYDRTGGILNQFNCGAYSSYYGFARLNDAGTEYLYGFAQSGGANQCVIVQIDPYTGAETGVTFDAIEYSSSGTGIAGGLAAFDSFIPGFWTLLGIIQNETIFGVGASIYSLFHDLVLKGILEPNSGYNLGVEDIIIKVKNQGIIAQSNFDVQYRVDGSAWVTETIPGPLAQGETIEYTFSQAYDFAVFGEYYIEVEVILEGDQLPFNNYKDKTIANFDRIPGCIYSITMWDDYGDGWNGGYVQIFGDGIELFNGTLSTGSGPETYHFFVQHDSFLTAVFTPGGWAYECSYAIYDAGNNLIFEDGMGGVDPTGGDIGVAFCYTPDFDAGITEIISPNNGINLGYEVVTVNIQNFGLLELIDIPVGFAVDNGTMIMEIATGPISSGSNFEYTFTAIADLSEAGQHNIEACTFLDEDEDPGNDCQEKSIYNSIQINNQTYDLSEGYQFISSYINPNDPDMIVVMAEVLNDNLDFVRNSQGQTLRKIGPNWVNGIGDWIIEEGYLVKMFSEDSFTIEGDLVDPSTPIPLYAGYQFVSYLSTTSIDALEAFESIIGDNLDFIRNSQAQTLRKIGPNWVNGIGDCQPDEGYLVKMFADDVLIYPCSSSFICGDPFTDPRNGQTYNSIQIGDQCWMAENLNIGVQIDGLQTMSNNSIIEKYCYDNDSANCEIYGGLYQWNEIMQYSTTQSIQGICPDGWHLPSDAELFEMENYLDPSINNPDVTGWRGIDCGEQMLAGGSSGFEALLAGGRKWDTGEFLDIGEFTNFWSSTINPYNQIHSWWRKLQINNPQSLRNGGSKLFGLSVRCLKDEINTCVDPITDTRDGKIYNIVQIGDQCWMAENLNIGVQIDGLQTMSDNSIIEKYCYDNDSSNCEVLGGLYQWNETMQYSTTQSTQGLCPDGWYLPSDAEWFEMENYLDPSITNPDLTGFRGIDCGEQLLEGGSSGFEALLAGRRKWDTGEFIDIGEWTLFWSSTFNPYNQIQSWRRALEINNPQIYRNGGSQLYGHSVRCLRDETSVLSKKMTSILHDENFKKQILKTDYFNFIGGNPADPVFSLYLEDLEIGDEVAAFDGEIMVGVLKVNSKNSFYNELPLFSTTVKGKGYKTGKPIILKVWDISTQSLIPFEYTMIDPYNEAYMKNTYPEEDGLYSIIKFTKGVNNIENVKETISIFPNPSDGIFNISIEGTYENIQVKVFDVHGNVYRLFEIDGNKNLTTQQLYLKELAAGVYFINFSGKNFNQVKKIVIQ